MAYYFLHNLDIFICRHLDLLVLFIGFIVSARAFNLPTRAFSLLTRGFELVNRGIELITRVLHFHLSVEWIVFISAITIKRKSVQCLQKLTSELPAKSLKLYLLLLVSCQGHQKLTWRLNVWCALKGHTYFCSWKL